MPRFNKERQLARKRGRDLRRAAADAAATRRENYMATTGRNIRKRRVVDSNKGQGLKANLAQLNRDASQLPIMRELNMMGRDVKEKYLPSIWGGVQRGLGALTRGWDEAQTARRDDKEWTLGGDELDISRGTPAYKWLLDNIIQPEYKDDFRREVKKDNLHWTELNKYAGDKAAGLAPRINLLNDPTRFEDYTPVQQANYLGSILDPDWENVSTGIENTGAGRKALNEYINAGTAMKGQGMIADAGFEMAKEAVPAHIKQATGIPPVDIERLRLQGRGGHQDLTTIAPQADEIWDETTSDIYPGYGQELPAYDDVPYSWAPEPYTWNALDLYPGLNIPFLKNQYFPNKAIEDITREDIKGLNQYERSNLGYGG